MQNVQNAAEIQQRVINLVELYRTKVGRESQIAKDAKEEKDYWDEINLDAAIKLHEDGMKGPIGIDMAPDMPEEWVKTLRVNDHLLGHFYSKIAGNCADKDILSLFLADYYDTSVFTAKEEEFLSSHFKEMVNYIIQTPCDNLDSVNHHDGKDWQLIPKELLQLVKNRVAIHAGSTIYNPFAGFAQIPLIYPNCKFICEDSYTTYNKRWNAFCKKCRKESNIVLGMRDVEQMTAWMKIALYANSINSTVIEDGDVPTRYDSVISFIPRIPNAIPGQAYELDFEIPSDPDTINKLITSYEMLPSEGKYVIILPKENLWASNPYYSLRPLWEKMIGDNSLAEIIQLPRVMSKNHHHDGFCMVIAEKGRKDSTTTMIDAQFAYTKTDVGIFKGNLNLTAIDSLLQNNGKEETTGLRKSVEVPTSDIQVDLLVPQVYVAERPSEDEKPVSLSSLCRLMNDRVREVKSDLPMDTPMVNVKDLSSLFQGALDINKVNKANCPNNPPHTDEYSFDENGNFVDDLDHYYWGEGTDKGLQVATFRQCIFLDGSQDAVLLDFTKEIPQSALCKSTGEPIAINTQPIIGGKSFHVFCPNNGIDALFLLAILRLPIVYRQLQAYEEFGLYGQNGYLKDIIVPTDTRIIYDEIQRLLHEQKIYKEQKDKLDAQKTEYINEVRMRKHDMGQYLFELVNIEDLMRYYVENRDKVENFCQELEPLLDNFRSSLSELSTLLDNLSKEEEFGVSELFNLDEYLSQLGSRHKAYGFKIEYVRDKSSIKSYYQKVHVDDLTLLDDSSVCLKPNALDDSSVCLKPNALDDSSVLLEPNALDDSSVLLEPNALDDSSVLLEPDSFDDSSVCLAPDALDDGSVCLNPNAPDDSSVLLVPNALDDSSVLLEPNALDNRNIYTKTHGPTPHIAIPSIYVAPNDIHRAISNILDNARKHGFTDPSRKDYEVMVRLSIDVERNLFQIDFCNNGNPLPEGMDKMRYGIKGEKAGKTGGTGIGGSYIKKFVEHYGGDYDVFMDKGWTVVRICLPIK